MDWLRYGVLARFRTWQVRHWLFGATSVTSIMHVDPRKAGVPVWYVSDVQVTPIAGVTTATRRPDGWVEVRLYFESPLGTETKYVAVPVERLTYR